MAFDLFATQKNIREFLQSEFPQYDFERNTVPEDRDVPREDEEVNPFFVVQFGQMYPRPRGKSIKGPRNDQYFSWMQIIAMSSVEDDAAAALSLVVDRLIGHKGPGYTGMVPDGGMSDYGSRQYSVRPVLYYQTQRFEYDLTQNGVGSYLSA